MGYSERSSGSGVAGAAGVGGTILLVILGIGLKVGLKVAARAARNSNRYEYNEPPPRHIAELQRDGGRQPYISPPSVPVAEAPQTDWQTQQEALRQQQAQQAEAARQARAAEQAQAEQQRLADAARIQAELAQQQANQRAALEAARNPAPAPPVMQPPVAQAPAPQPGAPAANPDMPPGFPVTALDQVKQRETVFARAQDGWYPAVIMQRRGAEVTVKYTTNGVVDRVSLNRIRLQTDPANQVAQEGRPAALRPVAGGRDPANKPEPEDDALYVAKPGKVEQPREEPAGTAAARPNGTAANVPRTALRTWTNDTGEFKVEAALVGFEFDLVQLKKQDGKVISLRLEQLSAADQAFIREQHP